MARVLTIVLLGFVALGVFAWSTDKITSQGERTVYTVECVQGAWEGEHCTGRLAPGRRYRFRALKAHREVLFWTLGDQAGPSGRYSECSIVDGHNWSCNPNADSARTIAHQFMNGQPVEDASVPMIRVHQISKWKWVLLDIGIPVGRDAST